MGARRLLELLLAQRSKKAETHHRNATVAYMVIYLTPQHRFFRHREIDYGSRNV